MRLAMATSVWGIEIGDLDAVLAAISGAGFSGVEFAQRPQSLGIRNAAELRAALERRNLELLTVGGGTLNERLAFLEELHPHYVQVREWDLQRISLVTGRGLTPAVHPGMFQPMRRMQDVVPLLESCPELRLLLDVAHLTIAGDDPEKAIRIHGERTAAVHLKDWVADFGRFGHRYGRGFVDLGTGMVNLSAILSTLREIGFHGWLVVGMDRLPWHAESGLTTSRKWLASQGLLAPARVESDTASFWSVRASSGGEMTGPSKVGSCFREAVAFAAADEPHVFYSSIMAALDHVIPCYLITIWSVSPTQHQLARLASTNPALQGGTVASVLDPDELLCGLTLQLRSRVTHFDLSLENPGAPYGLPEQVFQDRALLKDLPARRMITLPVYNSWNHNYIRLLINLFPLSAELAVSDEELYWMGRAITMAADARLDRMCLGATTRVNQLAGRSKGKHAFLEGLLGLVQETLDCAGVAVFLANEGADKLVLESTTGTNWYVPEEERFYARDEGLTGGVWQRGEPLLSVNSLRESGHRGKSGEKVGEHGGQHACIWMPLVDHTGEAIGVVRCRNKRTGGKKAAPNMFIDDDTAVLDAICQAAVPHVRLLLAEERRVSRQVRLTHELKVPVVAIRGATELMQQTEGVQSFFDYDYPGDIWSWSELMRRLLGNAELVQSPWIGMSVQARVTPFMSEVVAPAVRQVSLLLRERQFSPQRISYKGFEAVPYLWIDRNQFQQVVFNLLSNAIKYGFKDPRAFEVEICAERQRAYFALRFRDWGPGISPAVKDKIFEEGFRSAEAIQRNVSGQGVGLAVVRQVVEAHGGHVEVTSLHMPTELTIFLPESLARQAPPRRSSQSRTGIT